MFMFQKLTEPNSTRERGDASLLGMTHVGNDGGAWILRHRNDGDVVFDEVPSRYSTEKLNFHNIDSEHDQYYMELPLENNT